mmetsp:Transcript_15981/g.26125  ORF Transcript_15981/g.26125 Transcript_15981/m.26125 type:complete len:285 (-) Transcript_15981:1092-1946(-)|eukprot:CAMPEP_0203769606 /NCGR_PEP_ID=MMETSP0099_2-20121227/2300_1 /ASSEMBLY_ACC=CAM_ASM_000209 /TAXON_ID=96639 /ORGANISM=" , Strain NY0313808BC1" /LENGTH=284 /DNA_ID=CAMNT_0050666553 /DNA_START=386 /DNA_END=1240 /DNA_ORIENTATION=+
MGARKRTAGGVKSSGGEPGKGNGNAQVSDAKPSPGDSGRSNIVQFLICGWCALPWVNMAFYNGDGVEVVKSSLRSALKIDTAMEAHGFLENREFWVTVAGLSLPHIVYFFTWTNAKRFATLCKTGPIKPIGQPYQVFARLAHVLKMVQLAVFMRWYFGADYIANVDSYIAAPVTLKEFWHSRNMYQLLLAFELLFLGQVLNFGVYRAIGEAGVYYGCRLGKKIPWVHGFPFNFVPHPQYVGAVLSFWGILVFLATTESVENGLYALGAASTVFYTFSSLVEQYL